MVSIHSTESVTDALLLTWGILYLLWALQRIPDFPESGGPISGLGGLLGIGISLVGALLLILAATRRLPIVGYGILAAMESFNVANLLYSGPVLSSNTFIDSVPDRAVTGALLVNVAVVVVVLTRLFERTRTDAE